MKKHLLFLLVMLATQSFGFANTITAYDLYTDSNEKQPLWIELEAKNGKAISRITFYATIKGVDTVMFNFKGKRLATLLKISYLKNKVAVETEVLFKSSNQRIYNNYYGDASIQKDHEYNMSFDITNGCLTYIEDEFDNCRIEIADMNVEESAVWGSLVKR